MIIMSNLIRILNAAKSVLNINTDVNIAPMRVKLDDTAYAYKVLDSYFIYINEDIFRKDKINNFNIRVIIHELYHIKQMIDGDLKFSDDHKVVYWKNIKYDKSYSYDERPFEVEARLAETKYFKQVKKLVKEDVVS